MVEVFVSSFLTFSFIFSQVLKPDCLIRNKLPLFKKNKKHLRCLAAFYFFLSAYLLPYYFSILSYIRALAWTRWANQIYLSSFLQIFHNKCHYWNMIVFHLLHTKEASNLRTITCAEPVSRTPCNYAKNHSGSSGHKLRLTALPQQSIFTLLHLVWTCTAAFYCIYMNTALCVFHILSPWLNLAWVFTAFTFTIQLSNLNNLIQQLFCADDSVRWSCCRGNKSLSLMEMCNNNGGKIKSFVAAVRLKPNL